MKILFLIISIFLLSSPSWSESLTIDDLSKLNDTHICEDFKDQTLNDAIILGKIWDMEKGKLVNDRHVSKRVADINKDGIKEILMQRESGGNCCAPKLSIIIFDKNCKISKLDFPKWQWVWGWEYVDFKLTGNLVDLIAPDDHWGMGVNELNEQKVTYRFDGDSISFVSSYKKKQILASAELRSSQFSTENNQEDKEIFFDLNNDQILEKISCNYWYRWGSLTDCKIILDGINILDVNRGSFHPKRLGILPETKNGWNVLVVDYNERLVFDPVQKVYRETNFN